MRNLNEIITELKSLPEADLKIVFNEVLEGFGETSSSKKAPRMAAPLVPCPNCNSTDYVVRNGHKHGKQAFWCKNCCKSYTSTTNTLLCMSHYGLETWRQVLADTIDGISLDKTSKRMGISHKTLFYMRHKIMLALEDYLHEVPAAVGDVAEADETYVPESFKGKKFAADAVRAPKKRGTRASKRGLSDQQICICTAVQRKTGSPIVRSENRARPSVANVQSIYKGHIQPGTLILTDGMNVYPSLARTMECSVTNVKKEKGSFYNLNTVNALHSYIKERYHHYRGVATKYLNRYNEVFSVSFRNNTSISDLMEVLFGTRGEGRSHHGKDVENLRLLSL